MKKWFEKFLKNLEKANKKNFGSEKLDCCDVNQKSYSSKRNKK